MSSPKCQGKKPNTGLCCLLTGLVVAAVAVAVYFFVLKDNSTSKSDASKSKEVCLKDTLSQSFQDAPSQAFGAKVDSASYYIGVILGSQIKGSGFADELSELNLAQLRKGTEGFLAANAKKAEVSTTESGLQYTIHAVGAEYKVQVVQSGERWFVSPVE